MTNERQNIALAKRDGIDVTKPRWVKDDLNLGLMTGGTPMKDTWPDYDTDNEIDRMIRALNPDQVRDYFKVLLDVMGYGIEDCDMTVQAAVGQKKEALLRFYGDWE